MWQITGEWIEKISPQEVHWKEILDWFRGGGDETMIGKLKD